MATSRPRNDQELTRALAIVLAQGMWHARRESAGRVSGYGLSMMQARVLGVIDEPLSMRELSQVLACDPSNLTLLVTRLEEMGLVERRSDAVDRRVRRVVLTERGRERRGAIIDVVFGETTVFDALSRGEKQQLLELLRRVFKA